MTQLAILPRFDTMNPFKLSFSPISDTYQLRMLRAIASLRKGTGMAKLVNFRNLFRDDAP